MKNMVKELNFVWNEKKGESEATFVSTGYVSVQIQRSWMAAVSVSGNLPGMTPCVVGVYQNVHNNGILFGIDLPIGVEVTVKTGCKVTQAKIMGDD